MSEKFTKGPWFIAERPTDDGLAIIEDGLQDLFPITCEWTEAHLISAAPDMYNELKNLLDVLPDGEWSNTKRDIAATLAKARGEDQ